MMSPRTRRTATVALAIGVGVMLVAAMVAPLLTR